MATPSLYKHVGSLAKLRSWVGQRVIVELTERLSAAALGRSGEDALRALMMRAYRSHVVVTAVLRCNGLEGSASIHAAQCFRAAAHGFGVLEAAGGFGLPEDLDNSYEQLTDMVVSGIVAAGRRQTQ